MLPAMDEDMMDQLAMEGEEEEREEGGRETAEVRGKVEKSEEVEGREREGERVHLWEWELEEGRRDILVNRFFFSNSLHFPPSLPPSLILPPSLAACRPALDPRDLPASSAAPNHTTPSIN